MTEGGRLPNRDARTRVGSDGRKEPHAPLPAVWSRPPPWRRGLQGVRKAPIGKTAGDCRPNIPELPDLCRRSGRLCRPSRAASRRAAPV